MYMHTCRDYMSVCTYSQTVLQETRLYRMSPLKNMLQMTSPQTYHLYDPTACNTYQTRFKYTICLHIRLYKFLQQSDFFEHRRRINITMPFAAYFLSSLPVYDTIRLTSSIPTHIYRFNPTHFFWSESPFSIWLKFYDSILLHIYY